MQQVVLAKCNRFGNLEELSLFSLVLFYFLLKFDEFINTGVLLTRIQTKAHTNPGRPVGRILAATETDIELFAKSPSFCEVYNMFWIDAKVRREFVLVVATLKKCPHKFDCRRKKSLGYNPGNAQFNHGGLIGTWCHGRNTGSGQSR